MRYSPVDDYYFRFVSDDQEDLRCLFYTVSEDFMVLATEGQLAKRNEELLADVTWDRSFIYRPDSDLYDPSLAAKFRPFLHTVGDGPVDD